MTADSGTEIDGHRALGINEMLLMSVYPLQRVCPL